MNMRFGSEICTNLTEASGREWLETNGLGGYASSTICGMNTRRYHGLLVAATHPPVERFVLLSKIEEMLTLNGRRYDLSCNRYPGVIHPEGHRYLQEFRLSPFPVFVYRIEDFEFRKSVFMIHGQNSTVVTYEWNIPISGRLELRPLMAFRGYHSMTHQNNSLNPACPSNGNIIIFHPYQSISPLYLFHEDGEMQTTGDWYRNFEYEREEERGLDFHEDLFNPFSISVDLRGRTTFSLFASTQAPSQPRIAELRSREEERRIAFQPGVNTNLKDILTRAAEQFIVKRGDGKSVVAGYHWFGDWGRDTMIAFPGLTLSTKRFEEAKQILLAFAKYVDRGMIPNRFPDEGETPEYNTVDATLWYFEAARAYAEASGDSEWIRSRLYEILAEIIDWHLHGTRFGIHVEPDGLLTAGEPGVQLTWMDAKVGNYVVTPRHGKAVEIQALWYNALRTMEQFARESGREEEAADYGSLANRARKSFNQLFWNESAGCLYDVVNADIRDGSIRPNQVFAISLHYPILDENRAKSVMSILKRDLLTPVGLRSLSPVHPDYCGKYEGEPHNRDAVYHQGTVWSWLMGPYITAYLKTYGDSPESRKRAKGLLDGFHKHVHEAGVGQVSEIFDGDPPHRPAGCIAQAWSVAELLRACTALE